MSKDIYRNIFLQKNPPKTQKTLLKAHSLFIAELQILPVFFFQVSFILYAKMKDLQTEKMGRNFPLGSLPKLWVQMMIF